jgi:hypothetical protein
MLFTIERKMFRTSSGLIGLGPEFLKAGDEIALVKRSMTPLVLRPDPPRLGSARQLIGDAYVHGIMQGEMFSGERCGEIWLA